jgi:hypothetical protein
MERARNLSAGERSMLPRKLRRELTELERALARMPVSVDDARALETTAETYEAALAAADVIAMGRRATFGNRWRGRMVIAAVGIVAASPFTWMVYTGYADIAESCGAYGHHKSPNWRHIFSYIEPRCIAANDSECTEDCEYDGSCTAIEGECVVTTHADCRASRVCVDRGACELYLSECVVGADAHCRDAEVCTDYGRCERGVDEDGEPACVAGSQADCTASVACHERGMCYFIGQRCGTKPEWCAGQDDCHERGSCSYDEQLDRCLALADDDCAFSEGCLDEGRCSAIDGTCQVAHAGYCVSSNACRAEGRCVLRNGVCATG